MLVNQSEGLLWCLVLCDRHKKLEEQQVGMVSFRLLDNAVHKIRQWFKSRGELLQGICAVLWGRRLCTGISAGLAKLFSDGNSTQAIGGRFGST